MAQDCPKMASRWSQNGGKTEPSSNKIGPRSPHGSSGIAYFSGWPKIVKIGVSCRRGAIFGRAMLNFCHTAAAPKPSPPQAPPTLRDGVGTTKHVTSYILFRYICIYIYTRVDPCIKCTTSKSLTEQVACELQDNGVDQNTFDAAGVVVVVVVAVVVAVHVHTARQTVRQWISARVCSPRAYFDRQITRRVRAKPILFFRLGRVAWWSGTAK